jgi:hypothetical protein
VDQLRLLLRQPDTWWSARAQAPNLIETETRVALERLDPH